MQQIDLSNQQDLTYMFSLSFIVINFQFGFILAVACITIKIYVLKRKSSKRYLNLNKIEEKDR